ncbi:hypothetical protein AALO_G00018220 [Alosa alosa]|uniref:Uncharacterized protein n=1 Tax=Alosa alosa TaxID=278164 RepID=A0AAV6HMI8_9TELE|nr:hypothetical protein AALO_G00018220 [Alosa alosa]
MNPCPERCTLTPIQESEESAEESQSSFGILHSELPTPTPTGKPTGWQSPDDEPFSSPQSSPVEPGDCSSTSEAEHGKSSHEHVLSQHSVLHQQPTESPAAPPPRETAKRPAKRRRAKADGEAKSQKRPAKQRGASTPPQPPLPLWLVSLMHNIEEATHYELLIE